MNLYPIERLTILESEDRDDDDRAALQAELEASLAEAEAGEVVDFSAENVTSEVSGEEPRAQPER